MPAGEVNPVTIFTVLPLHHLLAGFQLRTQVLVIFLSPPCSE